MMIQADSASKSREQKAELRREMKRRLGALDARRRRRAAEDLVEKVLGLPEVARAERVFVCLSFGVEIETRPLIDRLLKSGRRLFLPRVVRRDPLIHVHAYPCELTTLRTGLSQPRSSAPEVALEDVDQTLEVALILGLAFDLRGYRLGYGGGYFDRFLAGRSFPAVGLAFPEQIVDQLPAEAHDIPMSKVIIAGETTTPLT